MAGDISCSICGYYRGHPNRPSNPNGIFCDVFICSPCQKGEDMSMEREEQRLGA